MVRNLERRDWKIGDKEVWRRSMWIEPSEWEQSINIFASHVNTLQRATYVQNFNQLDKMTHFVDVYQPLSPTTRIIASGLTRWPPQQGWEVKHGIRNMDFHSPRPIQQSHCWVSNLPTAETNWAPDVEPFPRGISQLPVAAWFHCTVFIMEGTSRRVGLLLLSGSKEEYV